jgi:hypothetical protein
MSEVSEIVILPSNTRTPDCPALLGCGQLAQVQEYTGLAAGAPYEAGARKPATWVVRPAGRRRRVSWTRGEERVPRQG